MQDSKDHVSKKPLAEWMFIVHEGLDKADAVLVDMIPGSGGFKALHLDQANERYFLCLNCKQTEELQARVGINPVTMKPYVQVWSHHMITSCM